MKLVTSIPAINHPVGRFETFSNRTWNKSKFPTLTVWLSEGCKNKNQSSANLKLLWDGDWCFFECIRRLTSKHRKEKLRSRNLRASRVVSLINFHESFQFSLKSIAYDFPFMALKIANLFPKRVLFSIVAQLRRRRRLPNELETSFACPLPAHPIRTTQR